MHQEPLTIPTAPEIRSRLAALMREQRMLRGLLRVVERKQDDDQLAHKNVEAFRQEGGHRAS